MEIVTIYRIENQSGRGIFRCGITWDCEDSLCARHSNYPIPQYDEELNYIEDDEYCAFNNIDDLVYYVEFDWMLEFLSRGFSVYEITIDRNRIRQSKYQTLYKKKDIKVIRKIV